MLASLSEALREPDNAGEGPKAWVQSVLHSIRYEELHRKEKGLVRQHLRDVTGYSRAQIARYIQAYCHDRQASVAGTASVLMATVIRWSRLPLLLGLAVMTGLLLGLSVSRPAEHVAASIAFPQGEAAGLVVTTSPGLLLSR